MKYPKYLALAAALILMGAGCASKTDTTIEAEGGLNPTDLTQTMPAGSDTEVDEMMVGGDAMVGGEEDAEGGVMMEGDLKVDAEVVTDGGEAMMEKATHVITFDGSSYSTLNLTINVGDTVTWKNEGSAGFWPASNVHPTHQLLPGFDAGKAISAGGSYSFTFDKAGAWTWHDHLRARETGTITVR